MFERDPKVSGALRSSSAILISTGCRLYGKWSKCLGIDLEIANSQSYFGYPGLRLFAKDSAKLMGMRGIREFSVLLNFQRPNICLEVLQNGSKLGENGQFPAAF